MYFYMIVIEDWWPGPMTMIVINDYKYNLIVKIKISPCSRHILKILLKRDPFQHGD